jgi:16S rRNA (guanine966-N2)-methyltransferase
MSRLRIISGEFGGRLIKAPSQRTMRPMGDRVRTALFNMVDVEGKRVLDAYAGSGAIGLEALSRGAVEADFVDKNRQSQLVIAENIGLLSVGERARLYRLSISSFLDTVSQNTPKYDIVFVDPPYHLLEKSGDFSTVFALKSLVKPNGLMILSYPGRLRVPTVNGVVVVDNRRYGEAALAVFRFE